MNCPDPSSGLGVIRSVLGTVDCHVQTYSEAGYHALTGPQSFFPTALTALLTIYVALLGLRLMFGIGPTRLLEAPVIALKIGAILALTLLILGYPVNLLEMALLVGVYSVEYLVMAGISDFFFGFWGSLIIGAGLTLILAFLLFRNLPSRLLKILLFGLIAFFTVLYPLSGLLDQIASLNSFNAMLQAGMIVFLFGLSLYSRLRAKAASVSA